MKYLNLILLKKMNKKIWICSIVKNQLIIGLILKKLYFLNHTPYIKHIKNKKYNN